MARGSAVALCLGPGPLAARRAAEALIARGVSVLASVGYAGGLDPTLPSGGLVVAERIVSVDGAAWPTGAEPLRSLVPDARVGAIVGLDAPAATVEAKRGLGALGVAVDTESHAVAAAAARAGIACIAIRAIVDAADRTLPDAALAAIGADGGLRTGPLLAALAARPREVADLFALARCVRHADRSLVQAGVALASVALSASRSGPRSR